MEELKVILEKFADSGWELIAAPSRDWLDGKSVQNALRDAIREADRQCGSCGPGQKVVYPVPGECCLVSA